MKNNNEKIKSGISLAAAFVFTMGMAANTVPAYAKEANNKEITSSIRASGEKNHNVNVVMPSQNKNTKSNGTDKKEVKSQVRLITADKYENKDKSYEIKVVTPKIEGLSDKTAQDKLNDGLKEKADKVIKDFQKNVAELKKEFGEQEVYMGVEYGYEVKADNNDVLAFDVYTYYMAGSSSAEHDFYTINKNTGEIYTLEGMFKDGVDFAAPINEYIKKEMARINEKEDGMFFLDEFKGIKEDQDFYINNDGKLVISFDKYEVAAGAQGTPEFVIPGEVIADVVK